MKSALAQCARVDPPAAVRRLRCILKLLHLLSCLMKLNIQLMLRRQASISYPVANENRRVCAPSCIYLSLRRGIIRQQSNEDMRGSHSRGLLSSY